MLPEVSIEHFCPIRVGPGARGPGRYARPGRAGQGPMDVPRGPGAPGPGCRCPVPGPGRRLPDQLAPVAIVGSR